MQPERERDLYFASPTAPPKQPQSQHCKMGERGARALFRVEGTFISLGTDPMQRIWSSGSSELRESFLYNSGQCHAQWRLPAAAAADDIRQWRRPPMTSAAGEGRRPPQAGAFGGRLQGEGEARGLIDLD